jgi:hypothetical protein
MDIITLKAFFLWCTIINGIMLLFTPLMCIFAADLIYPIHSRLFKVSRETFNTMVYSFIQLYKMLWLVFNVVPWLALLIIC